MNLFRHYVSSTGKASLTSFFFLPVFLHTLASLGISGGQGFPCQPQDLVLALPSVWKRVCALWVLPFHLGLSTDATSSKRSFLTILYEGPYSVTLKFLTQLHFSLQDLSEIIYIIMCIYIYIFIYKKAETLLCQQRSVQSRLLFFQWSYMDVRVGLWRKLSTEELMLLNCGVGEESWESLGLQGDPTSPF